MGARAVLAAAAIAAIAPGCAGPCARVAADRAALLARKAPATDTPHARITLPYAVVNRLLAEALIDPPRVPLPTDQLHLGPLAHMLPALYAVPRSVELGTAPPGHVRFDVKIEIGDDAGPILVVTARAVVEPTIERARDHTRISLGIRPDALTKFEADLSRVSAVDRVRAALVHRLPAAVAAHVPAAVLDEAATALTEAAITHGYDLLHATLLSRLGELTRVGFDLPGVPVERVDLQSTPLALELGIATGLPVRRGVGSPPADPPPDTIGVQIAGSTAAELGNWGIASGYLPAHYTRGLKPAADGAYVPHFDWRHDDARPLVVHMFKLGGGCAHFIVGMQPHVEVVGDRLRGWLTGRELEHADAPLAFELLARLNELFESSTVAPKSAAAATRVTVGGRAVTARIVRASFDARELDAALAVAIAPRGEPPAPAPASSAP